MKFFGRNLSAYRAPGFAHETRWRTTSALKRLLSTPIRETLGQRDAAAAFLQALPPEFKRWSCLAQDQYVEIRTLLTGYLLSSQGDRMLMAHSVEGRFPFLDKDVVALAQSLPDRHKLRVLDEKHVLKRAARDLVPEEILRRPKQPFRAPDALSFVAAGVASYVPEMLSDTNVRKAGVFEPKAVSSLWRKCQQHSKDAHFSNTDNMALVGVLSTQLLHEQFVRQRPSTESPRVLRIDVEVHDVKRSRHARRNA
jgi:asparagine synthase (glutamine-hydrolysing)